MSFIDFALSAVDCLGRYSDLAFAAPDRDPPQSQRAA